MHWPCIDHVDFSLNLFMCAQLFQLVPLWPWKVCQIENFSSQPSWTWFQLASNLAYILVQYISTRSTPTLKLVNQSVQQIIDQISPFKLWPLWPWRVGRIQNLCSILKSVVRFIHPQVQETQFWNLKQNGHQSADFIQHRTWPNWYWSNKFPHPHWTSSISINPFKRSQSIHSRDIDLMSSNCQACTTF
jgi:hypothetical protein